MGIWRLVTLTAILIVVCSFTFSCTQTESWVSWEDPKGDVLTPEKFMGRPFVDIVGVKAAGNKEHLTLIAIADKSYAEYFSYKDKEGFQHAYTPVEFYLDIDNNPDSGVIPKGVASSPGETKGYEIQVSGIMGYKFKNKEGDKEYSGSGFGDQRFDTSYYHTLDGVASCWLRKPTYGDDWSQWENIEKGDNGLMYAEYVSINGNKLILKIPYKLLNLKSGQTIRIAFKEVGHDGTSADRFSANNVLVLK